MIDEFPDNFEDLRILVIGDVMVDRYWWGSVDRISPEAPVPVVRLSSSTVTPGGAANVAANISGLGAIPFLVGCIGTDDEAALVPETLSQNSVSSEYLIAVNGRPTTTKTRIVAHNQHVTRIDQESSEPFGAEIENQLIDSIEELIESVNIVLVSDYAKGVASARVLTRTFAAAHNLDIPVIVDPKGTDYSTYRGATILTPNRKEAAEAARVNVDNNVAIAGKKLLEEVGLEAILITEGDKGMTLFAAHREAVHFPASARDAYDVTGAGDTVIATLTVMIAAGADLESAVRVANVAAGVVVEQVGTTPITLAAVRSALDLT